MAIRDLVHNLQVSGSLAPAARTDGSETGTSVDLQGVDAALIVLSMGAYTDGSHQAMIQHSDDNSTFTDVPESDLQGALIPADAVGSAGTTQTVGYVGAKRYVRTIMVTTGSTSGALSATYVVAGIPHLS